MADEAVLRIILQDGGGGGSTPQSTGAPSTPTRVDNTTALGVPPSAGRPQYQQPTQPSYAKPPKPEPFKPSESGLDEILKVVDGLRGTIGGIAGPIVGAVIDVVSSFRKAQIEKEKEDYNRELLAEAQRTTAAVDGVREAVEKTSKPEPPQKERKAGPEPITPTPNREKPDEETARSARGARFAKPSDESLARAARGADIPVAKPAPEEIPTVYPAGSSPGAAAAVPIIAAVAIGKELHDAVVAGIRGAIGGAGNIASGIASPNTDPSVPLASLGNAASKAGEKLGDFGFLVVGAGEAVKALAGLMQNLDRTAERYGEYSPEIAQQQAIAEIRQTMGDFRRAQEAGSELARYIQVRTDLQQKFEDIKVKLLTRILSVVNPILETLEKLVPSGEGVEVAITILTGHISALATATNLIASLMPDPHDREVNDPTDIILNRPWDMARPIPGDPRD